MVDTKRVPPKHPLAEVFGFPTDNHSPEAQRHRRAKLCPYHKKVQKCTKDKALDPLGVCSIYDDGGEATITCPIRFRENWIIADDAASFFFPATASWTSLTEIRLKDGNGLSAGNIDVVLVSYDERGTIMDFGSLEVQAVYISGNVRHLFYRNTAKVALSTLFTRIEQSWRLCSSVKFVGLCIARSSSVPETCNHSQGEFSAIVVIRTRTIPLH